jgi:hypothetical protein
MTKANSNNYRWPYDSRAPAWTVLEQGFRVSKRHTGVPNWLRPQRPAHPGVGAKKLNSIQFHGVGAKELNSFQFPGAGARKLNLVPASCRPAAASLP